MNKILEFIKRHSGVIALIFLSLLLLSPSTGELRAIYLAALAECAAIAFSGMAAYAYTKIDFCKEPSSLNLGLIFLGAHICAGLTIVGVYMAQLS